MKHILIISALALAFLTGCVSNEVFSPVSQQEEICFTTPVIGSMTKAPLFGEINGTDYPEKENFVIYAVHHPGTYYGWTSPDATPYINGREFTYDSSDDVATAGGWIGLNQNYYWPKSGVLSFGGYSPAGISGASYGADGLVIENFAIAEDASQQLDLMYADRIYNRSNSRGPNTTYNRVDIAFKHALSSIKFSVQLDAAYTSSFKLTSIKLNGLKYKGTFREKISEEIDKDGTITSSNDSKEWYVDDDLIDQPYVAFSSPEGLDLKNNYKEGSTDNYLALDDIIGQNDLILMPQTLGNDAIIEIEYTVDGKPESSSVKLNDLPSEWEIGKRYIYNITLKYDMILVGADVKSWGVPQNDIIPID